MEYIFEAKINTEDRNKLPDSAFGIPSKRKYPLTDKDGNLDEKHVLQAVRFFNKADESDKEELAKNILKAAKKLKMDYSNWKDVLKYAGEVVEEYMVDSWNLEDAKKICMRIHQKADADKHPLLSNQNCQICTWCTEANFRGIDVLPRPIHSPRDPALEQTGEDIIINPIRIPLLSIDNLVSTIKDAGTSRWYCHVKWKDGNGGHEFVYLNYGFEIYLMDSQQGILAHMDDPSVKSYTDDIDWKESYIARMDNKELNTSLLEKYNSMDMFVQWDPKLDIPYMKEHGMITDEDIDQTTNDLKQYVTEHYLGDGDDEDGVDSDYEEHEPDDCYCESGDMSETEAFYKRWKDEEGSSVLKQAKDIVKKIAKKVKDDEQPPCGNQNCKLCTWCAEAQFRGIDVLPRPLYSPRDPALNIIGETIVKDPVRISIQNGYDGMLEHLMEPVANVARFYCHVNWNNSTGGHEFIILKIGKQNFFIVDAQAGIVEPLSDTGNYFNDINYANSFICRLDNRDFNKELFEKYNDPKSIVPWDGRLDIPYMLENRMLSEEEAEQYWKEHPDEKPVQESKMILNSNDSRIPKLMCEGWKIAGTTINNEYILIQEGYDDISLHVSLIPATMSDVPNMEEWEYECMKDAYPNREIPESEMDKLKAELHQDAIDSVHKTRMIQYDYETIGMLTAYKVLDDQYWYIAEIYLIEEYRGKGIAKYILKNEIDQHDKLILNVYQNNKHAIELYESLGFEITQDGDGRFIMELDKTKHKTKYQPSNVFTLDEYKKANKYRSIIVGEIHNSSMLKYYDKLLSERKPEYFISEFAHEDRVLSLPELKQKLDMATNGEFKPGIPDYQDNYAIYKLAYDHGCKLIGCDLNNGKHYNRMHDEDHEREAYMLKVLEEFENTNFVCQLGDHHLRSIPITKEFLDYCGDTKDDRGIVSDLTVDNASPIWVHFTHEPKDVAILREPNELKNELDFINQQTIQEGYWQDIKNGVNPKSKKVWFHVSFDDKLDEKGPMIPRIPTWLEEVKKDGYTTSDGKKTHDLDEVMKDTGRYENYTTPRVCFSPSIEGALNSIINMWKLKNKDFPGKQLYVYVPEKPISQYKHKTNKELVRDKEVFDAGTTGESWILEPVKVKFYGSIKIDKVKDNGRKHKVLIRPGFEKETDNPMDNYIGRFTYKWHWLIHPSILKQGEKYEKSEKNAQSPLEVCNDIIAELKNFEYGIVKNGKLSTSNNSIEDYNKYYKFMTLDEFEKYRGGICYDYVEWEEAYLRDHGKSYKKYYLYADTKYNDTHTFVLVKNNNGFIYIESAFKPIEGVYPVKNLQEALDIITKAMFKMNGNDKLDSFKYYVWEYKGHPEYGSSKGEPIFEGTAINPKKSKGNK